MTRLNNDIYADVRMVVFLYFMSVTNCSSSCSLYSHIFINFIGSYGCISGNGLPWSFISIFIRINKHTKVLLTREESETTRSSSVLISGYVQLFFTYVNILCHHIRSFSVPSYSVIFCVLIFCVLIFCVLIFRHLPIIFLF